MHKMKNLTSLFDGSIRLWKNNWAKVWRLKDEEEVGVDEAQTSSFRLLLWLAISSCHFSFTTKKQHRRTTTVVLVVFVVVAQDFHTTIWIIHKKQPKERNPTITRMKPLHRIHLLCKRRWGSCSSLWYWCHPFWQTLDGSWKLKGTSKQQQVKSYYWIGSSFLLAGAPGPELKTGHPAITNVSDTVRGLFATSPQLVDYFYTFSSK